MQHFFSFLLLSQNFKITIKILLLLWYVHFMEVDDYAENIHLIFEEDTPKKTKQNHILNYDQK